MPEELFVDAIGLNTKDLCPICTMVRINQYHGINPMTPPHGEEAKRLVDKAYQYYEPINDKIYGHNL